MTHLKPSTKPSSAMAHLLAQQNGTPAPSVILSATYRTSLISLILRMCSTSTYTNITNFEWYIDTLVELAYVALQLPSDSTSSSLGLQIRDQIIDVVARVKAIRPFAVKRMAILLSDENFLDNGQGADVAQVLAAAAWICGEYCR